MEFAAFLQACDELLRPFLTAQGDAARARLEELLRDLIRPQAEQVIFYELRNWENLTAAERCAAADDFRELLARVEVQVALRLHKLHEAGQRAAQGGAADRPIERLAAYIRSVARRACQERRRQQRPGRKALADALRYALNRTRGLALWHALGQDGGPELLCGREVWRGRLPDSLDERRETLRRELAELSQREALSWLFERLEAPVRFEAVVDLLASAWDVDARYATVPLEYAETVASGGASAASTAALIGLLSDIWTQVKVLESPQPAVLLLQLPDSYAQNMLREFVAHGIATEAELADTIGVSVGRLAELYPILPLSDHEIAQELGLERTGIRSVRQSARRRLRRLGGDDEPE